MPGVAAAAADDLLTVGEGRAHEPGLRGPAAVQLGQPPAVTVGQRPGGGVGAQEFHGGGPVVVQGHPPFEYVAPHPVVQRDRQSAVAEPQPQLVVLGLVRLEAPLGAAPLGRAHRQGGPDEAGAALDGVLLAAVERGLEGPVVGQRAYGEGLGVDEGDARPPVEVQELVVGGEVKGVTAGRSGQKPRAAVLGDLRHASLTDSNKHEQVHSSANIIKGGEPSVQRLWTTRCPRNACRIVEGVPVVEPRRRDRLGEP